MEYQCDNDHALVDCDQADGQFDFSRFVPAWLIIANENADLSYLVDYGRIISVALEQPVTTLSGRTRPCPCGFPSFWSSTSNAKFSNT